MAASKWIGQRLPDLQGARFRRTPMPPVERAAPPRGFEVQCAIPILRMLDEAKAKAFYLDYLGFEVDWEGRFSETAPLYMQIRLGGALIHLDGHADENAPVAQAVIPVLGLENYRDQLNAKGMDQPEVVIVDPRYEGRDTDMNIDDPFGNHLIFYAKLAEE
jgi:hypothetical protein